MRLIEMPISSDRAKPLEDPFAIYRTVMCGDIVILKGAVDPSLCRRARDAVFDWGQSAGQSRDLALQVRRNVHLASYLPPKSESRYILHSYDLYLGEPLSDVSRMVRPLFDRMRTIYQQLTRDQHDYAADSDGRALLGQSIQYPQGGGFFQEHVHEIVPQQIGLILAASEHGRDYEVGGVRFRKDRGSAWVETEGHHAIGDICLFRYDIPHDITPVDPHVALDWTKNSGRWSFVLPLKSVPKA